MEATVYGGKVRKERTMGIQSEENEFRKITAVRSGGH